jgi:hypothetical protein
VSAQRAHPRFLQSGPLPVVASALARCDIVLVVDLEIITDPSTPFRNGPIPLRWRVGRPDETVAAAANRVSYTSPLLRPLLWDIGVRWHHKTTAMPASPSGFVLSAVEIIRLAPDAQRSLPSAAMSDTNGVALLHGTLPVSPPSEVPHSLHKACDIDPGHGKQQRAWINEQLPQGCSVSSAMREALSCVLVTATHRLPRLMPYWRYLRWTPEDQWMWRLYYSARYLPDPENLGALRDLQIRMSSFVRGMATFRGLVLTGTAGDPGRGEPGNFYDGTSFQLRTFYADAVALACLQRIIIDAVGVRVAQTGSREPKRAEVTLLEQDLLAFRRGYWSATFGRRGDVDTILAACQREFGLPVELGRLVSDTAEFSRQLQASATETTNAVLGLLTAVGLPVTVALAIWQGLPVSHLRSLWPTLWISAAVCAGIVVIFPGLRRLLISAFRQGRSGRG